MSDNVVSDNSYQQVIGFLHYRQRSVKQRSVKQRSVKQRSVRQRLATVTSTVRTVQYVVINHASPSVLPSHYTYGIIVTTSSSHDHNHLNRQSISTNKAKEGRGETIQYVYRLPLPTTDSTLPTYGEAGGHGD